MRMIDPTTARGSIEVLDQDVVNLDPEAFEVRRVTVPLEECCLIYLRSNAALRSRTLVHKDFDACSILGPQARGTLDGSELHPYSMMAAERVQQHYGYVTTDLPASSQVASGTG